MKKAAKALLLALPLLTLEAPAASADANADLLRAFKDAKKWDDVLGQLKGVLPTNVQEEFKLAVKDQPFPTIRVTKEGLMLLQSDGSKMTLKFGKDGKAYVNGKEWRLKPLATVEAEVKRLGESAAAEGGKRASVFSFLMPTAVAGPAFSAGAAAVAAATSSRWRAEACKGEELADELEHDCPQMAVGMLPVVKVADKKPAPKVFKPISMKCASQNGGTFEIQSKSADNSISRVRIKFEKGVASAVQVSSWEADVGRFMDTLNTVLPAKDEDDEFMSKRVLERNKSTYDGVCNGPKEELKRFQASLSSNRKELASLDVPGSSGSDGDGQMRPPTEMR